MACSRSREREAASREVAAGGGGGRGPAVAVRPGCAGGGVAAPILCVARVRGPAGQRPGMPLVWRKWHPTDGLLDTPLWLSQTTFELPLVQWLPVRRSGEVHALLRSGTARSWFLAGPAPTPFCFPRCARPPNTTHPDRARPRCAPPAPAGRPRRGACPLRLGIGVTAGWGSGATTCQCPQLCPLIACDSIVSAARGVGAARLTIAAWACSGGVGRRGEWHGGAGRGAAGTWRHRCTQECTAGWTLVNMWEPAAALPGVCGAQSEGRCGLSPHTRACAPAAPRRPLTPCGRRGAGEAWRVLFCSA